jgi:endonuclease/exonuclease/phosphatase (EEP) superfamily protein YafD
MDNADDYPIHPPQKRSKIVSAIAWALVVLLVPMSTAWIIGGWVYWFDVLASQQMLIGWIVLGTGALMLIARRRIPGVICILLAMVSLYPVFTGRHLTLAGVDLEHKPDGVIRVVTWNTHPQNDAWRADLEIILQLNADVIVLLEVPPELSRSIRNRNLLDSTPYSNWKHRAWVDQEVSPSFLLSRWKVEQIDVSSRPAYAQHHLFVSVDRPDGAFVAGLIHPLSPRTKARWLTGNRVAGSQTMASRQIRADTGLPIVLGVDLNAGPAMIRARQLRGAGIKMSKPTLRMDASFPMNSSVPAPIRIQLDDVWSTDGIEPIAWDMLELSGSDHQAVIVDFRIVDGSIQ